jgi:hypothetical protein
MRCLLDTIFSFGRGIEMPITIRLEGLSDVVGTLPKLPANIERSVILQMSQRVYEEAYEGAARHSKTGNLLASLYNRSIPGGREAGHVAEQTGGR